MTCTNPGDLTLWRAPGAPATPSSLPRPLGGRRELAQGCVTGAAAAQSSLVLRFCTVALVPRPLLNDSLCLVAKACRASQRTSDVSQCFKNPLCTFSYIQSPRPYPNLCHTFAHPLTPQPCHRALAVNVSSGCSVEGEGMKGQCRGSPGIHKASTGSHSHSGCF